MNKRLRFKSLKRKRARTDFLFPKNTFLSGMGSVLNIAGNYYEFNSSNTDMEADAFALRNDWECIGKDIKSAHSKLVD